LNAIWTALNSLARSKLSALFNAGSQGGDDSLSYTRPKEQVQKAAPASAGAAAMNVQLAAAVHAYKLCVADMAPPNLFFFFYLLMSVLSRRRAGGVGV
jgi:hypothetical protein